MGLRALTRNTVAFFGKVGIDSLAEPGLLMAPLQPLVHEDLAEAAPLDRDALLFVEIGLQTIDRPGAEGQTQAIRLGQGRGDHLGALLGGVGLRSPGPGAILQPGQAPLIEAMEPGLDGGARTAACSATAC